MMGQFESNLLDSRLLTDPSSVFSVAYACRATLLTNRLRVAIQFRCLLGRNRAVRHDDFPRLALRERVVAQHPSPWFCGGCGG